MFRVLHAILIVALLSGKAWTAASAQSDAPKAKAGLGLVLLAALQR